MLDCSGYGGCADWTVAAVLVLYYNGAHSAVFQVLFGEGRVLPVGFSRAWLNFHTGSTSARFLAEHHRRFPPTPLRHRTHHYRPLQRHLDHNPSRRRRTPLLSRRIRLVEHLTPHNANEFLFFLRLFMYNSATNSQRIIVVVQCNANPTNLLR